ncbi:neprilysin-2 [Drosophila bipectinata]|uniref:neprilysin-2 n=1 Tax=Drosophila bipectinata TaxID=42026 RepID=UPI001C89FA66|nr:neprilysin-2 [Drosophila bipectinata]
MNANITIFLCLLAVFFIGIPPTNGQNECLNLVDKNVDKEAAPCDDFYAHACGNWYGGEYQRNFGVHDARSMWVAKLKEKLIEHFESDSDKHSPLSTFYRKCFSDLDSKQSITAYNEAMVGSGANFSILGHNKSSDWDWILANAELRKYGAQGLWRLLVQDNWQSADQKIFYLLSPTFHQLGHDELTEFLYERYLKVLLIEMGVRVRRAQEWARNLVDFEKSLQSLLAVDREKTLVLREPQTLVQLEEQLPELQLRKYFEVLLKDIDWDPNTLLVVVDMDYLQSLQRFLRSADRELLSTWLLLKLPMHFEFKLHTDEKIVSQKDYWVEQLRHLLPGPLGRLQMELLLGENYQEIYDNSIQQVAFLFRDLKQQFELLLNETEVFDYDLVTRTMAREKIRAMRLLTPRLQDPGHSMSTGTATPLGGSCDWNLMQLSRNRAHQEFRQVLGEPPVSHAGDPLVANAYYRLSLNRIELPLGLLATPLLQEPTCRTEAERKVRLSAGLGYILAHEMVHAFDYDGINYDASGQLANGQWPPRAIIRFGLRAACYMGARYSNAAVTMNENIADTEGLRLAFETYRPRPETNSSSPATPDPELLKTFFLVYAQTWCGKSVDLDAEDSSAQNSLHSKHQERVNNVLANLPEFAETFQCKAGSPMNPAAKCRIW